MLTQFAMVVVALFAVLSLVIDVGQMTLTRAQMQNAADSAALEGLRLRNVHSNGFESDCERRIAARNLVRQWFDDSISPLGEVRYQYGAGPMIALSGGETASGLNGYQTIEASGDTPDYKPDLQLNQVTPGVGVNLEYGDMVSGRFTYTGMPDPSEDAAYGTSSYSRNDFTPNLSVPTPDPGYEDGCPMDVPDPWPAWTPPPEPTAPLGADDAAFLVRLRRTSGNDTEANILGVSSGGPALPLLFGRATTIHEVPGAPYSVRRDGLTVRGTAIAQARPALRIGGPDEALIPGLGAVSFALDRACWAALPAASVCAVVNDAGTIAMVDSALCASVPPACAGDIVDGDAPGPVQAASCPGIAGQFIQPAHRVGDRVVSQAVPDGSATKTGFVPLYQTIGTADRVIGFGRVAMCGTIPGPVTLRRRSVRVAAQNASAHLDDGLPTDLAATDASEILRINRTLDGSLLVPVLAR